MVLTRRCPLEDVANSFRARAAMQQRAALGAAQAASTATASPHCGERAYPHYDRLGN